ncbi:MAG: 16S rRNA (uracil(1498)-N(3))-methyltransferase [Planctomycetes bacterium]|nr:16S rRNA (uracil(1498)-N(3))-methyltransferase [Planctomycetota bacterium]
MSPRQDRPGQAAERRFLLAPFDVRTTRRVHFADGDAQHARVVLRMVAGDTCIGIDGAGHAWPLLLTRVEKRGVEAELAGPAVSEPAPGALGAALPWIEVAVAMPRASHAEEMIDSLVQLGAAALVPLVCERSQAAARFEGAGRRERWHRISSEACKQSGRLWNLQISDALSIEALAQRGPATWVRCDPRASTADLGPLDAARCDRAHPLVLLIGPEGGFTPAEELRLDAAGAHAIRLGPHILRTETAAVAALAVLVARLQQP